MASNNDHHLLSPHLVRLHRVADFGDSGGVLIELATGSLCRLNPTATRMVSGLLQGHSCATIARQFKPYVSASVAQLTVHARDLVEQLEAAYHRNKKALTHPCTTGASTAQVHFTHEESGTAAVPSPHVVLNLGGTPWLAWSHSQRSIARLSSLKDDRSQRLLHALKLIAPHIAAELGSHVLHGSSVVTGRTPSEQLPLSAVAWLGASGAGKSSCAQRAVKAGWGEAVADDVVLLAECGDAASVGVVPDAEARLHTWCASTATLLAKERVAQFRAYDMWPSEGESQSTAVPLRLVAVLSAERRMKESAEIKRESLAGPDALLELMRHSFAEIGSPEVYAAAFAAATTLAQHVRVERWFVPDSLPRLEVALRALHRS